MGYPTKEGTRFVKKLIKHEEGPWYFLLLPNGKWAALWDQGLDSHFSEAIFEGNYEWACAFIGSKKETIEFVLNSLSELQRHDPHNYNYKVDQIRERLFRSNSKFNKFPD